MQSEGMEVGGALWVQVLDDLLVPLVSDFARIVSLQVRHYSRGFQCPPFQCAPTLPTSLQQHDLVFVIATCLRSAQRNCYSRAGDPPLPNSGRALSRCNTKGCTDNHFRDKTVANERRCATSGAGVPGGREDASAGGTPADQGGAAVPTGPRAAARLRRLLAARPASAAGVAS